MALDLDVIVARLRAQVSGLKAVGGAADLDAAIEGAVSTPSGFVIPLAERAERIDIIGFHEQLITQAFGVILVITNRRDVTGAAALSDLAPLRVAARDALAGWAPTSEGLPVEITGGRLLSLDASGRLWWADEFELKTYYRRP